MATKKLRKTKIHVNVENLDERPEVPAHNPITRPREPERTATYWRNCYEAERRQNELLRARWWEAQDENKRLKAQLESGSGRKRVKRFS